MSVVLGDDGRAVIHNRETGQEMSCSVPTAIENVANSRGIWAHGVKPEGLKVKPVSAPVADPVIPLVEPDVLPLPAAEQPQLSPAQVEALDRDGNGEAGGSLPKAERKPKDPERGAIIAALKAAKIKFFAGAPTEKLKALLPA